MCTVYYSSLGLSTEHSSKRQHADVVQGTSSTLNPLLQNSMMMRLDCESLPGRHRSAMVLMGQSGVLDGVNSSQIKRSYCFCVTSIEIHRKSLAPREQLQQPLLQLSQRLQVSGQGAVPISPFASPTTLCEQRRVHP